MIYDLDALKSLKSRIDAASEGDRELDKEICILFNPYLKECQTTDEGGWIHPHFGKVRPPEGYTRSIDAALALIAQGVARC